jgi:ABC-type multidrug transport system permease subunit
VLAGRTFSDLVTNTLSLAILLVTGVIIGFSFNADVLHIVAGILLLLLFGYAFSWVFAFVGLIASTPESANSVAFIAIFPLTFISSAFVPVASMPSVLQAFAKVNPFTITVNAIRALWLGLPPGNYVWQATLWAVGITAVFAPLAVSRYRKQAGS